MTVCRRDYRDLSPTERSAFVEAVKKLHDEGDWEPYADFHQTLFGTAHGGPFFLPWHREFLARIEADLQRVSGDPHLAIPYWDWTSDRSTSSDLWSSDFMGAFDGWTHSNGQQVRRDVLGQSGSLPTAETINDILNTTPYEPEFRSFLEGPGHGPVHPWVGGIMAGGRSPFDPIFLLHHGNVDRIWAEWQSRQPGTLEDNYNGNSGQGLTDAMAPWNTASDSVTPAQVLDHHRHPRSAHIWDTDEPTVDLRTTSLTFPAVAEGRTTAHAVVFGVISCEDVTFEVDQPDVTAGPADAFGLPVGNSVQISPSKGEDEARVWVSYQAGSAFDTAEGTVTIRATKRWKDFESGDPQTETEEWTVPITATTVPKPKAAIDLVIDKSGSMSGRSGVTTVGGDDITRMELVKSEVGAYPLVQLLDNDDAIGVVSFDQDAQPETESIVPAGPPIFGSGRENATGAIGGLEPGGSTSIGDGIELAHGRLSGLTGYDTRAIVVLTDGHENTPKMISEVSALIDEHVFAIGMGTPEVLRPAALKQIVDGTDGDLMLTGRLDPDDRFRVAKYYLQILAGVKNSDIVTDPDGYLKPGAQTRIPFTITEADSTADVVVLGPPVQHLFDFALETPDGDLIEPQNIGSASGLSFEVGEGLTFYRLTLPTVLDGREVRPGTWHAILGIEEESEMFRRYLNLIEEIDPSGFRIVETNGARYNLSVHTQSSLTLTSTLSQNDRTPGATFELRAALSQYDLQLAKNATVEATVTHPDGIQTTLVLDRTEEGTFEAAITASQSGVYRVQILAAGHTLRGQRFTREETLTGVVWEGGDDPVPDGDQQVRDEAMCRLVTCLTEGSLVEFLEERNIDVDEVRECVENYCETLRSTVEHTRRSRP